MISNMFITTIIERQNLSYFDIRIYTMFLYFRLELRANYSNLFNMANLKCNNIFKAYHNRVPKLGIHVIKTLQ